MPRAATRTRPQAVADPEEAAQGGPVEEGGGLSEFANDGTPDRPAAASRRSRMAAAGTPSPGKQSGGWAGYKSNREARSGFAQNFKVEEGGEGNLVRFIGDGPFFSYYRHWLRDLKGRQTFVCLDDECPLCAVGDTPSLVALFNVIDLTERANARVLLWEASPQPAGAIEAFALNSKLSPIDKPGQYFHVTKSKQSNGFNAFALNIVKGRDIPEDWGFEALSDAELTELEKDAYDESTIKIDTVEFLREVVKSMGGDE